MATITVNEARLSLHAAVDTAQAEDVFLYRDGAPAAVLVSVDRYDELVAAARELARMSAVDDGMDDTGERDVWEQVAEELA